MIVNNGSLAGGDGPLGLVKDNQGAVSLQRGQQGRLLPVAGAKLHGAADRRIRPTSGDPMDLPQGCPGLYPPQRNLRNPN